jgi:hypothetical protein
VLPHGPFKLRTINMKNKVDLTLDIDASFIQTNSCTNINPIKCIGLGLYGFEDDGSFTQWLVENPYEENEVTIHFIEITKNDDDAREGKRSSSSSTRRNEHIQLQRRRLLLLYCTSIHTSSDTYTALLFLTVASQSLHQ